MRKLILNIDQDKDLLAINVRVNNEHTLLVKIEDPESSLKIMKMLPV